LSRFASIFLTLLIVLAGGNFAAACNQESFASLGDLCALAVQSSFPDNDQLASDTYDANGNTTVSSSRPAPSAAPVTVTDVYSFDNKLIRRTRADGVVIDLYYNADGDRVGKWVKQNGLTLGTHRYLMDRQNPTGYSQVVEETDSTGTLLERAFYGHDLLATESRSVGVSPTSSLFFYHYDGLGSVRGLSDDTGTLIETYTYDAYGTLIGLEKPDPASGALVSQNLTNPANKPSSSHLFTGEQWDTDLGMYFLRARYLNPDTGRFHTRDTYEGRNGEPLSLHKYLYANGNPVNGVDPSGNCELTAENVGLAVTLSLSLGESLSAAGVMWLSAKIFTAKWRIATHLNFGDMHMSVTAENIRTSIAFTFDWTLIQKGLGKGGVVRKSTGLPENGFDFPSLIYLGDTGFYLWQKWIGISPDLIHDETESDSINCWTWAIRASAKAAAISIIPM
jgi:RHS repeat-associated protein